MLDSTASADIAVGYLFISGRNEVAEELGRLEKVRILVGRPEALQCSETRNRRAR